MRMECAGICSAGEREHRPADADADEKKEKERPEDVFDAVLGAAAAEESEGYGNHHGEEKERLEMRQFERRDDGHALCPRAAS